MLTQEQKDSIYKNYMLLLNSYAECWHNQVTYGNSFRIEKENYSYENFIINMRSLNIEYNKLDREDFEILGFMESNTLEKPVFLIPIVLKNAIPEGTRVVDKFGNIYVVGHDFLNNSNTDGYLSYGIILKET